MRDGRLQQFDTPLNIYNQPANRFVAGFVGNPSMNFITGRAGPAARMFVSGDIHLPLSASQCDLLQGRERVTLGIRPEHVHVSLEEQTEWLQASVYVTELMGNETFVFLKLGGEKIIARAPADFRAEPETPVRVRLDMDRAAFFDAESDDEKQIS
jgi:multiple sugar transport system ATP-binding protein